MSTPQSPRRGNDTEHQFSTGNCIYSYVSPKTTASKMHNVSRTETEKGSQGQ